MMMGALQGGLTFQKGLGAVHALSHALGGLKQPSLHHGTLNAILLPPVLRFNAGHVGDKIERLSEDHYRLTNGMFTSCDLDKPAWSFHVAEADVTLDDYAHMKDVTFRAHDIPLIFTPRLVWPTKSDRSRGFLIPRVLFSTTYGDRLELGYFVPFGDSADATFYGDLNDKGYNGGGINIRYRPSAGGGAQYAHTVNDTGCAMGRMLIAILDNYQQADGSVKVPDVLVPVMAKDRLVPR